MQSTGWPLAYATPPRNSKPLLTSMPRTRSCRGTIGIRLRTRSRGNSTYATESQQTQQQHNPKHDSINSHVISSSTVFSRLYVRYPPILCLPAPDTSDNCALHFSEFSVKMPQIGLKIMVFSHKGHA